MVDLSVALALFMVLFAPRVSGLSSRGGRQFSVEGIGGEIRSGTTPDPDPDPARAKSEMEGDYGGLPRTLAEGKFTEAAKACEQMELEVSREGKVPLLRHAVVVEGRETVSSAFTLGVLGRTLKCPLASRPGSLPPTSAH